MYTKKRILIDLSERVFVIIV